MKDDIGIVSTKNEETELYLGFLNYRLVQYPVIGVDSYKREGIVDVISLIGGFIGMMKNFSYLLLGGY